MKNKYALMASVTILVSAGAADAQVCSGGTCLSTFGKWEVRVTSAGVMATTEAQDGARAAYGCGVRSGVCTWGFFSPKADCIPDSLIATKISSNGLTRSYQAKCGNAPVPGRTIMFRGDLAELLNMFFAADTTVRTIAMSGDPITHTFSGNGADIAITAAYQAFAKVKEILRDQR